MNRATVAATLIAPFGLIMSSGAALAQTGENDEGLYIGAGLGQFNIETDGLDDLDNTLDDLDSDDNAYQGFIGWRLNPYIALQAAYINYGGPEESVSSGGSDGKYEAELSGFAPSIIGTYPLGPVEISAKLGYYFYDLELSGNFNLDELDFDSDDSGEDVMYGVGLGMTFLERLHAKVEYEEIDVKGVDDSNAYWLTGQWRF